MSDKEALNCYVVVVNGEGQYSIWPDREVIPEGWQRVGFSGEKEKCLAYINDVWTDMRPKSLRLIRQSDEPDNMSNT